MPFARRARATKEKTKTFTGCWTCRARKVKCDGVRPDCGRCGKANLRCEGYGVKLHWITEYEAVAPSAIKRQAMSLEGYPQWLFSSEEIDLHLEKLDQNEVNWVSSESLSVGPFTIFRAEHVKRISSGEMNSCEGSIFSPRNPEPHFSSVSSGFDNSDVRLSEGSSVWWDLDTSSSTYSATHSPNLYAEDGLSADDDTEPPPDMLAVGKNNRTGRFSLQTRGTHLQKESFSLHFGLNANLYQDPFISWLMDHYVNDVTHLLQPIMHPQNTYSSIYVPIALIGSGRMLFGASDPKSNVPASNAAIFYSLLATSAFHLRDTDVTGRLVDTARAFRAKSFAHLQRALQEPATALDGEPVPSESSTSAKYESAMSAMLTLVTADASFLVCSVLQLNS